MIIFFRQKRAITCIKGRVLLDSYSIIMIPRKWKKRWTDKHMIFNKSANNSYPSIETRWSSYLNKKRTSKKATFVFFNYVESLFSPTEGNCANSLQTLFNSFCPAMIHSSKWKNLSQWMGVQQVCTRQLEKSGTRVSADRGPHIPMEVEGSGVLLRCHSQ